MEQNINIKRLTCDLCGKSVDINNNYTNGFQKIRLPCLTCFEDKNYGLSTFHNCDICTSCYYKLWYKFRNEVAEINYDTENRTLKVHLKCDITSE